MNRIKKPSFEKLLDEAIKLKINVVDEDAEQLFYKLAGVSKLPEYEEVYVHMRNIDKDELQRRKAANETIPMKTVMPKSMKKRFLEIIAKEPMSYSGYDFTREYQVVNYSTTKTFKCYCGTTNKFEKEYKDKKGNTNIEMLDEVYCSNPDCLDPPIDGMYKQRHWYYIGK